MNDSYKAHEIVRVALVAALAKKAVDIVVFDVSQRFALADIFFIVSASNERQVNSIVDGIEEALLLSDYKPLTREGRNGGRWVLLNYSDVVFHVQHEDEREFYALDRLFNDCPKLDLSEFVDNEINMA